MTTARRTGLGAVAVALWLCAQETRAQVLPGTYSHCALTRRRSGGLGSCASALASTPLLTLTSCGSYMAERCPAPASGEQRLAALEQTPVPLEQLSATRAQRAVFSIELMIGPGRSSTRPALALQSDTSTIACV